MLHEARLAILIAAASLAAACGGVSRRVVAKPDAPAGPARAGTMHVVKPGETLWRVAREHGIDAAELAALNNIDDATKLAAGHRLFVPSERRGGSAQAGASTTARVAAGSASATTLSSKLPSKSGSARSGADRAAGGRGERGGEARSGRVLRWPVDGVLVSRFGARRGRAHDGIDIAAPRGTPVLAAADGVVVYSDDGQRAYGNLIIIKHDDGLATVYAHNEENLVEAGARVRAGALIARVGATGRAEGPHLHFEVRVGGRPTDPLKFVAD